jgi:HK97 family phage prohead protease
MLRFEMDVLAADLVERTIEGVVVPYGETARIGGIEYRFAAGSLQRPRSTPLLVDHDRTNPVGVLAELVDGETGALGRFRVDATPAGDTALVQAASGSRGSLSVGAELVDAQAGEDGVVDVHRAIVRETSLVAIGAFEGAAVTRVAAEADEDEPPPAPPAPDDEPDPDPDPPAPPAEPEEVQAMDAPVIIAARDRAPAELNAGELVQVIIRAQHGEPDARRYIEAALQESISTDVSGLLPPTFERTVIGGKQVRRPLYNAFRSRPLPGVGLQVNKPAWTTRPDGAWAATVDDDAHSTKVVIGSQSASVIRWDWAGAIPWVVVQRSDPSIIDEIYAEAVQDFYVDVEAKIGGELTPAAPATSTTLGAAIAEFYVASGGKTPDVIIAAPDVWGELADAGLLTMPVAGGSPSASSDLTMSYAGIPIVASGTLAAGSAVLATRRAVDARTTEPVRLTANAIGALNVELAVVGEGLFDTDYPAELLLMGSVALPTGARSASRKAA